MIFHQHSRFYFSPFQFYQKKTLLLCVSVFSQSKIKSSFSTTRKSSSNKKKTGGGKKKYHPRTNASRCRCRGCGCHPQWPQPVGDTVSNDDLAWRRYGRSLVRPQQPPQQQCRNRSGCPYCNFSSSFLLLTPSTTDVSQARDPNEDQLLSDQARLGSNVTRGSGGQQLGCSVS